MPKNTPVDRNFITDLKTHISSFRAPKQQPTSTNCHHTEETATSEKTTTVSTSVFKSSKYTPWVKGMIGNNFFPAEALHHIFSFINPRDLLTCRETCLFWKGAADKVMTRQIESILTTKNQTVSMSQIIALPLGQIQRLVHGNPLKRLSNKKDLFLVSGASAYKPGLSKKSLEPFTSRSYSTSPTTMLNVTRDQNKVHIHLWDQAKDKDLKFSLKLDPSCKINPACITYSSKYVVIGYEKPDVESVIDNTTKGEIIVLDHTGSLVATYTTPYGSKAFNGVHLQDDYLHVACMDLDATYKYSLSEKSTYKTNLHRKGDDNETPAKEVFVNANFFVIPISNMGTISQIEIRKNNVETTYDSQYTICGEDITSVHLHNRQILAGTATGSIYLFSLPRLFDGEIRESLKPVIFKSPDPSNSKKTESPITAMCIDASDNNLIVSGNEEGNISIWYYGHLQQKIKTRNPATIKKNPAAAAIAHLQITSEKRLIVGYKDGVFEQWDIIDPAKKTIQPKERSESPSTAKTKKIADHNIDNAASHKSHKSPSLFRLL
jgi:hypothetical protein